MVVEVPDTYHASIPAISKEEEKMGEHAFPLKTLYIAVSLVRS